MRQEVIVGIIEKQHTIDASIAVINDTAISVKEDADNITDPIDNIKSDVGNIRSSVTTIKNDTESIKSNTKTIKDNINVTNSDVMSTKNDIAVQKSNMGMIKTDLNDIRTNVSSNTGKIVTMNDNTINVINNDLNELEGKLNNINSNMATLELQDEILKLIEDEVPDTRKRYGVRIKKSEPDPYTRVEYTYDAVGMRPAKMNYNTGRFNYGSWSDVWFIKDNYPCMLKYDGTVDYKLNPNDYSKKEDGTISDIDNEEYEGNAMSRFPLIWSKFEEDNDYEYITVCEEQYDESYLPIAFVNDYGVVKSEMFVSMFEGCLPEGSNVIRSLMNKSSVRHEPVSGYQFATNNGSGWYNRTWAQRTLINALLTIISKSDNTQESFGNGYTYDYEYLNTGTLYNKGQFYGYNDDSHGMKIFHIENWWGNCDEVISGICVSRDSDDNRNYLYKMHGPYIINSHSSLSDLISSGYIFGPQAPSINFGIIVESYNTKYGRLPKVLNEEGANLYQCDIYTYDNYNIAYANIGWSHNYYLGAYSLGFSNYGVHRGIALSYIDPNI